jgi:peroxiredoxin
MNTIERPPVSPGEPAPDFTLPSIGDDEPISLADYRGRSPVFLALHIGLWCPFCRRHIAHMSANEAPLKALGVESLGVVATEVDNARLYFRFRPTRLKLAADPALTTHRAYGVPKPAVTSELMKEMQETRINPYGDLPKPLPVAEAAAAIAKLDGYVETPTDSAEMERQYPQLKGQFLIDRDGIVRWANIECATGLSSVGKFPPADEIFAAARALQ